MEKNKWTLKYFCNIYSPYNDALSVKQSTWIAKTILKKKKIEGLTHNFKHITKLL